MKDQIKSLWVNKYARYGMYAFSGMTSLGLFHYFIPELSDSELVNNIITGVVLSMTALTGLAGIINMAATGFGTETCDQLKRTQSEIWQHGGKVPIESVLAYHREAPCGQFGIEAALREVGTSIPNLLEDPNYLDQEVSRYLPEMKTPKIDSSKRIRRFEELRNVLGIAGRDDLHQLL